MAVVVTAAFGAALYYGQPSTQAVAPAGTAPVVSVDSITVHVSGAVVAPGLVEIPWSARVADAIAAAGGSAADANLAGVNLAAPVRDGEQIVVPALGGAGAASPARNDGRVPLNTATSSDLESIPGVGPVLAERIVAARDERGGFGAVEDLLDVAGIGEAKLAAIRDLVAVP